MFKHDVLSLVLNYIINVSQLSVEESLITNHSFCSMSVTQAMEWLIEHVDDPTVDTPLPGQDTPGAAAAAAAAAAPTPTPAPAPGLSATVSGALARLSSQASIDEAKQDELTEIFKRIRRKREFRPDSRVSVMWVS